jgi:dTDP-glucose 4,6-dehydratase
MSQTSTTPTTPSSGGTKATLPVPNSYTPQNILITGGAGFIGSHVVLLLAKKYPQYNIINLDKLDYCSSLVNLSSVSSLPNYKFIKGDICSPDLINYIFKTHDIDTVLHFAAQTHVDNSFGNSFSFTRNNVMGTHVLLEAAKEHWKNKNKNNDNSNDNIGTGHRFIHVSTDEVYGEGVRDDAKAMEEEHVLEPTNPYAATKAAAEFVVKSYHRSFQLPIIITRGNNVYGPHQFPEKLIPKFIHQLDRHKKVTVGACYDAGGYYWILLVLCTHVQLTGLQCMVVLTDVVV